MFKLYYDKKDAKTQAIIMYLSVNDHDYELINVNEESDIDVSINVLSLPILMKDDIVVMEGYKAEVLSTL